MDCSEIRKIALTYCKNKLSDKERSLVEKHIDKCKACLNYINQVKTKILPYTDTYIYPHAEINKPRNIKNPRNNKRKSWQRLIPNILIALSLFLIILGFALIEKYFTR